MTKDPKRQAASSQPLFVMMPQPVASDSEFSIVELCRILAGHKWIIFLITLFFTSIAIVYALNDTPIYRAEILAAPVQKNEQSNRLGGLTSQFQGLASLAGVSLPVARDIETTLATLMSRRFITGFIGEADLKPILFSNKWDHEKGDWVVPELSVIDRVRAEILADKRQATLEQLNYSEPSMWATYNYFVKEVLTVSLDKKSGLVSLKIDWEDPTLAAEWANALVDRLNNELRQQVIAESERGIEYLTAQIQKTSLAELRTVLYRIIEDHLKNITLARVNEEYALKIIDPAVSPQERIKPKRVQIVMFGLVFGLVLGVFAALLRDFIQRYHSSYEDESPKQGYFHFR